MKASPTQLTLRELRKDCNLVAVVERWNPHARIRQDLFGVIDVLALRGDQTIAVQSTSWANVSSRIRKIAESDSIAAIREAGWTVLVHGWRKSKKSNRYELKQIDIS